MFLLIMDELKNKNITEQRLNEMLSIEDYTDPEFDQHPVNLVLQQIVTNLQQADMPPVEIIRGPRVTTDKENFDDLLFPQDSIMRTGLHTLKVDASQVLRTQMSYMLLGILSSSDDDRLVLCPGLVFRREGMHHQMDIWFLKRDSQPFDRTDVIALIDILLEGMIPEDSRHLSDKSLYYIRDGCKLKVPFNGRKQTIADGGVLKSEILANAGLDPDLYQCIGIGISLDRFVMYIKGIQDYRVLRSKDPRITSQMIDLSPYKEISKFPYTNRDISIVVDNDISVEDLQTFLNLTFTQDFVSVIEFVQLVSETRYDQLPTHVVERLKMTPYQKNILVRFQLRDIDRTLTTEEANEIRDALLQSLDGLSVQKLTDLI